MSRVLTVRRVTVPSARVAEYTAVIAQLARRHAARGQQLWIFQRRGDPESWLEFSEGPDDSGHRATGPADAEEAGLERSLRQLAQYLESDDERWDECRPVMS